MKVRKRWIAGGVGVMALACAATVVVVRAQSLGQRSEFNPTTLTSSRPTTGAVSRPYDSGNRFGGSNGGNTNTGNNYGGNNYGGNNYNGGNNRTGNNDFNRNRNNGRDRTRGNTGFNRGPTTSRSIAVDYALVTSKSIFAKNHRTYSPDQTPRGGDRNFMPAAPPPMVLSGIIDIDGARMAFVEDKGSGAIRQYFVGDQLASKGTITHLDLDTMELELDGRRTRVGLGQKLDGTDYSSSDGGGYGGYSPTPSTPSPTPPGPMSEVLERLKARRASQMGGPGGGVAPPGGAPGTAPATGQPGGGGGPPR